MRRRVPRGVVALAATAILSVPAVLAAADNYRINTDGLVMHQHTDDMTVWNGVADSADSTLRSKINQARLVWRDGPGGSNGLLSKNTVRVSQADTKASSRIDFERQGLGQNNAGVILDHIGYHSSQATVTFNSYYSQGWSASTKQGKACNAIGNVLGLENAGAGRNDCMEAPTTYPDPGATSIQLVDDFWGPNLETSGVTNGQTLESATGYTLTATGTGHAMARADISLDGSQTPLASSNPVTACDEKCSRTAALTFTPQNAGWSLGPHTLHAIAKNQFGAAGGTGEGDLATKDITVTVVDTIAPQTTIDSGPPAFTTDTSASFAVSSSEPNSAYECRLDSGAWQSCSAQQTFSGLSSGAHSLDVRAVDQGANPDASPAHRDWVVDTTAPEIEADGGLTDTIPAPDQDTDPDTGDVVEIDAIDGDPTDPAQWESGTRSVTLKINGEVVATTGDLDCTQQQASCAQALSYELDPAFYEPDELHFEISATDELGQTRTTMWTVQQGWKSDPDVAVHLAKFSGGAPVKADAMADIAHPDSVRTSIRWKDVQPVDPTDPVHTSGIPDPDHDGWYLQECTDKVAPKYQGKRTPDDPYTATYCDRSVEARFALFEDPDDPAEPGELRLQPDGLILTQGPKWATRTAYDHGGATGYPPKQSRYDDWRTFARWALDKYAEPYGIQHVSLWLEPDNKKNWGGWDDSLDATHNETVTSEEYAELLNATDGAFDGFNQSHSTNIKLDAGEITAGGDNSDPVGPDHWARHFANYNTEQNWNDNYSDFVIHPFSQSPKDVWRKINRHRAVLDGVNRISVVFGWAIGNVNLANAPGSFKCASGPGVQESKMREAVFGVRRRSKDVTRMVWFSAFDKKLDKGNPCADDSGDEHYNPGVRHDINDWGLFRLKPNGDDPPGDEPLASSLIRPAAGRLCALAHQGGC